MDTPGCRNVAELLPREFDFIFWKIIEHAETNSSQMIRPAIEELNQAGDQEPASE